MCDVCVLAADAKGQHGSRLGAGARERLARQAAEGSGARDAERAPGGATGSVRGVVRRVAGRQALAALRTWAQLVR